MRYQNVVIAATGFVTGPQVLSSLDIEAQLSTLYRKLGLEKGHLERLTGIQERRLWPVGTKPSQIAADAVENLLQQTDVPRESIKALIFCGVCRDALEPSTASAIHALLGFHRGCLVFDISNACLGFLNGLQAAANMIELGHIDTALVVSGENAAPIYKTTLEELRRAPEATTFHESLASLTLGSAGVAFLLRRRSSRVGGLGLLGALAQADSSGIDLCQGHGDLQTQTMVTDTRGLMEKGLRLSKATWELFLRQMNLSPGEFDHVFAHQVSLRHYQKVFETLGFSSAAPYCDLVTFGNTGSAAAPLAMARAIAADKIHPGHRAALLGIGSGLNCMMMATQWL